MRILLVEDEPEMASMLAGLLGRQDILVDQLGTLALAHEALATTAYDAVLLDRQLPDGDGLELIAPLRARQAGVPVIVISAMKTVADRVDGLDIGADDYLAKPFSSEELLARLRAVLRRPNLVEAPALELGNLVFDQQARSASVDGVALSLTRRELLVLEALLQRQGRTVTRASLEESVFGFADEIASNSLDSHVSRLRAKLKQAEARLEVHAIRGIGYLLREAR